MEICVRHSKALVKFASHNSKWIMIFDSLSANEQICITGVFFTIFLFCYWYRRPSCFPPGPRGIPLIGVVPFLGKYPERTYKKWSKTYGPILSARLGGKETIVLNSFDVIQQVSHYAGQVLIVTYRYV